MSNAEEEFTGEYNPKPLVNFKIPLKSEDKSSNNDPTIPTPEVDVFSSPLVNYDNIPGYYPIVPTNFPYFQPPLQQPSENHNLKRKHHPGLISYNNSYLLLEDSYPDDLKSLIQAYDCQLCSVKMNSATSARMHYESKNHDKKINSWLLEWSKKTGEPVPKRQRAIKEGPVGPNALRCEICDLFLTSLQHAGQHYMGRKHRMVAAGLHKPSGSGYYNEQGQWIRQKSKGESDPSGRFGIGAGFTQPPELATTTTADSTTPNVTSPNITSEKVVKDPSKFCKLCDIIVTSNAQMKLHLEGSKHTKKLKLMGAAPHTPITNDTILSSLEGNAVGVPPVITPPELLVQPQRDNSIYRTPSGSYYCKACNITLTNEIMFNQHLDSKKHMKQSKS